MPHITNSSFNPPAAYSDQVNASYEICAGEAQGGKDSCQGNPGDPDCNGTDYSTSYYADDYYGEYDDGGYGHDDDQGNPDCRGPSYAETFMVYQEQSLNYKPADKDIRFDFETIKDTKLLYIATKGGSGDVSIILKRTDKQGVQTGIQHFVETAGNNEQAFTE